MTEEKEKKKVTAKGVLQTLHRHDSITGGAEQAERRPHSCCGEPEVQELILIGTPGWRMRAE